ncbi:MAG TPA: hypothetical protein VHH73_17770 [Verrucomicrobiae bacterium]|nr:hypothetical protein [Verrucomicrobiae bacterium]
MPITPIRACLTICLWLGVAATRAADAPATNHPVTVPPRPVEPPVKERIAPLYYSKETPAKLEWSFSPLLSHVLDRDTDSEEFDFAYPLLTYDRFGGEYRFQILQLFSFAGGVDQKDLQTRRFTLFPFYFQQRSLDTNLNYTAVMPFYGHLKNRLFRDEIDFVMMPLYLKSRKKDVVTENYLFPFFHLRHGDGLKGWQFLPIAGHEHKEVTTKTNGFGEVSIVPGHEKFFALWPLFFEQKVGIGTTNQQTNHVFLPFYSLQRSPARDSSTYLFPIGLTITDDREKKYHEWGLPWPLVAFARGEGKTMNRVWPLFGTASNTNRQNEFYLWPLYKRARVHSEPLESDRLRILYFLYSDLTEKNTETGRHLRRTDLWPLFTARHDPDGTETVQLLSLLEPALPNNKSIQRNYSPVWALWRTEKDPKTGRKMESYLLNLFRRETTPTVKKCSLLFGLLHYQSGPDGRHWRFFRPPEPPAAPVKKPEETAK